jgi:cell division protein FtsN
MSLATRRLSGDADSSSESNPQQDSSSMVLHNAVRVALSITIVVLLVVALWYLRRAYRQRQSQRQSHPARPTTPIEVEAIECARKKRQNGVALLM